MTEQKRIPDRVDIQMSYDLSKHTAIQIAGILKQHSLDLVDNCGLSPTEALDIGLLPLVATIRSVGKVGKIQGISFPTIYSALKEAIEELK